MATVRWTTSARRNLETTLDWLELNRGADDARRAGEMVLLAVERAAEHPDLYAWVGSVHPILVGLPGNVRRVLTRPPRFAVYFREASDELDVLAIRGGGQLPPTADELLAATS